MESLVEATLNETRQELLMEATGLDGHLVTTHRFASARPPGALLESFKAGWEAEGLRVVESSRGPWQLLSVRREAVLETLQLRAAADGGTEGLHSIWRRDPGSPGARAERERRSMHTELREWLPQAAVPVRELMHAVADRNVATMVATVADAENQVVATLARRLHAAGFTPAALPGGAAPAGTGASQGLRRAGSALAWRRGSEELVATVAAHRGETAVVIHWSRQR
jgi:hypothetical protein